MAKELAKVEAPAGSEAEALAALPRDLAIVKIQEDSMMAMAAAHPRDYVAILADIKQQIAAYKSFAQGIMYTKPVGGGKYATGLSIRAAESIKLAFGHCSVVTDISIIDNNTVKISATFTDFQRGNKWTDGGVLSKFYKESKKKGGPP